MNCGFPFSRPGPLLLVFLAIVAGAPGRGGWAADEKERILAFAAGNDLAMFVGKWDPAHGGWVQADDFFEPPAPGSPVTLYGTQGRIADVRIAEPYRAPPWGVPRGWNAAISTWTRSTDAFALAVLDRPSVEARPSRPVALDDPAARKIVSDYLRGRGLDVPRPELTQAYRADLLGDGKTEELLCAHSDESALRDDQPAAIYAVALLRAGAPGREQTFTLASVTSYKPADESIADHRRYFGHRPFFRWLAFVDVNGDGREEIALYRAEPERTGVRLFTWNGRKAEAVLCNYLNF